MTEPFVCIIVLHWFNESDVMTCVEALKNQSYGHFRIVIVDNGSTGDACTRLSAADTGWDYIRNPENLGYAGGCNKGIRHAVSLDADYVWLVNGDAVVTSDALTKLVEAAETDSRIGLVAPLMRSHADDASPNLVCGRFDRRLLTLHYVFAVDEARFFEREKPDEFVLMGAALLARVSMLTGTGGFDDRLFAYWEDIDLSLRCASAGFRNVLETSTWIYHPKKDFFDPDRPIKPHVYYYLARNEIMTIRKFGRGGRVWRSLMWAFLRQMDMLARTRGNQDGCQALLAGLWDGWIGRCGPWQPSRSMPAPLRRLLLSHPLLPRTLLAKLS